MTDTPKNGKFASLFGGLACGNISALGDTRAPSSRTYYTRDYGVTHAVTVDVPYTPPSASLRRVFNPGGVDNV